MRLLDLFCGAGGAAAGYHRAGFDEIVGVDIKPQPRYPFTFVQADALEYLKEHGREFDAIHASPPCQAYSVAGNVHRNAGVIYPDLVAATRETLRATGRPFVIENVVGAPLSTHVLKLCGISFGLRVFRHRLFECSFAALQMDHPSHDGKKIGEGYFSIAGGAGRWKSWGTVHRNVSKGTAAEWRAAMGIGHMTRKEMTQAIPPAYTEFIGKQLLEALR
mgnify:CR=1 FL=1